MEQTKQKKVWIIEPECMVSDIFARFCESAGYSIEQLESPEFALERLKAGERPDGITCNLVGAYNRMGGGSFFAQAVPYINGAAKLIVTGGAEGMEDMVKSEIQRAGVKILGKPILREKFTRNLAYLMGEKTEEAWVVEDCPDHGSRLVKMLQGDGYTTTHFGCHTEAIGALEQGLKPSVVVSDIANTGKVSVFEFYQHPKLKDAAKVIVTGYPIHHLDGDERTDGIKMLNRHTLCESELIDFLDKREN